MCGCNSRYIYIRIKQYTFVSQLGIGLDMPKNDPAFFLLTNGKNSYRLLVTVTDGRNSYGRGRWAGNRIIGSLLKTILENDWRCYRCRLVGPQSRQPTNFLAQRKVVVSYTFDPSDRPLAYNTIPLCHSCIHTRVCAVCWELVLTFLQCNLLLRYLKFHLFIIKLIVTR